MDRHTVKVPYSITLSLVLMLSVNFILFFIGCYIFFTQFCYLLIYLTRCKGIERKREREKERQRQRDRETERQRDRERQRERLLHFLYSALTFIDLFNKM